MDHAPSLSTDAPSPRHAAAINSKGMNGYSNHVHTNGNGTANGHHDNGHVNGNGNSIDYSEGHSGNGKRVKVACIQMSSSSDLRRNHRRAQILIESAVAAGARLILLPELWAHGWSMSRHTWKVAEYRQSNRATVLFMQKMAHRFSIWLGGTILECDGHHFWNTFLLLNPNGHAAGSVRKCVLTPFESFFINQASRVPHMIHTEEFGLVGVAIGCEAIDSCIWPLLTGAPPPPPRITRITTPRAAVNKTKANSMIYGTNNNNSYHQHHQHDNHTKNGSPSRSPLLPLPPPPPSLLSQTVSASAATITPSILLIPFSAPTLPHHATFYPTAERDAYHEALGRLAPDYARSLGVPVMMTNKCGEWCTAMLPCRMLQPTEYPGSTVVAPISTFPGRSTIADAQGRVCGQLGADEGVIVSDVILDPSAKVRLPIPVVPPLLSSWWQRLRALLRPPPSVIPITSLEQAHQRGSLTHVANGGFDVTGVYERGEWPPVHDYMGVMGIPRSKCTPRWMLMIRWWGEWTYHRSRERQRRALLIAAPFGYNSTTPPSNNNSNGNGNGNGHNSNDFTMSSLTKPSSYWPHDTMTSTNGARGIIGLIRRYGLELAMTIILMAWMWRRIRLALTAVGLINHYSQRNGSTNSATVAVSAAAAVATVAAVHGHHQL